MSEVRLGTIPEYHQKRDAVHVAIIPVTCDDDLEPGQHVGIEYDDVVSSTAKKKIGIVDPFLRDTVEAGVKFWLCLYPNTVKSLRHDWEHPDLIEPEPEDYYNCGC